MTKTGALLVLFALVGCTSDGDDPTTSTWDINAVRNDPADCEHWPVQVDAIVEVDGAVAHLSVLTPPGLEIDCEAYVPDAQGEWSIACLERVDGAWGSARIDPETLTGDISLGHDVDCNGFATVYDAIAVVD